MQKMTSLTPSLPVIPPEVFTVFGWYHLGVRSWHLLTWFRSLEASSSFKSCKKIQILRRPSLGQQARKLCTRPRFGWYFSMGKKSCAGGPAGKINVSKKGFNFFWGAPYFWVTFWFEVQDGQLIFVQRSQTCEKSQPPHSCLYAAVPGAGWPSSGTLKAIARHFQVSESQGQAQIAPCPKNHWISKLGVWRSLNPAIQIQTPL